MPQPVRILTVDVEDWFHILDHGETATEGRWKQFDSRVDLMTTNLLDLFDRHKQRATFFVLGYIAHNHPELIQEISRRGHDIGTHSHLHQLVYQQTPDEFEADLIRSMNAICRAGGKVPRSYRAPGFSITKHCTWAFDILHRNGIRVDCSIFPAQRAHGGLEDFPVSGPCLVQTEGGNVLREFPLNVVNIGPKSVVFSGGGYFRMIPSTLLNILSSRSQYLMTYFHPRDFDPDQPIVPGLAPARRFKSYVGLGSSVTKLTKLLDEFEFMTVCEAEEITDWTRVKAISVVSSEAASVK